VRLLVRQRPSLFELAEYPVCDGEECAWGGHRMSVAKLVINSTNFLLGKKSANGSINSKHVGFPACVLGAGCNAKDAVKRTPSQNARNLSSRQFADRGNLQYRYREFTTTQATGWIPSNNNLWRVSMSRLWTRERCF
jgi:hypothetical protein